MLHKITFQNNIYKCVIIKESKGNKKNPKETKEQRKKNKRSKPLIPILEEVVKISGMIFESHQEGSSV